MITIRSPSTLRRLTRVKFHNTATTQKREKKGDSKPETSRKNALTKQLLFFSVNIIGCYL